MAEKPDKPLDTTSNPSNPPDRTGGNAEPVVRQVSLTEVYETEDNARRHFDPAGIKDLAADILRNGLMNALVVRKTGRGYELIAGARRYRACNQLGMSSVEARVFDVDEIQARLMGLSENLSREDLNPYDEAIGILDYFTLVFSRTANWDKLVKEHGSPLKATSHLLRRFGLRHPEADAKASFDLGMTGEQALELLGTVFGERVEMNVQTFAKNRLRLLSLHKNVQDALRSGQLEYSSALVLQRIDDDELREQYIKTTIEEKLTVNDVTDLVNHGPKKDEVKTPPSEVDVAVQSLRRNLRFRENLPPAKQKRVDKLLVDIAALLEEAKDLVG